MKSAQKPDNSSRTEVISVILTTIDGKNLSIDFNKNSFKAVINTKTMGFLINGTSYDIFAAPTLAKSAEGIKQ